MGYPAGPLRRREGEFDRACLKKFKCPGVGGRALGEVEVSNSTTTTTSFICRTIQLHTSIAKAIYNYGLRI